MPPQLDCVRRRRVLVDRFNDVVSNTAGELIIRDDHGTQDGELNDAESDLEPLPPAVRRSLRAAVAAISVVVFLVLLWVAAL
jgi:hypothetical protein